MIGITPSGLPTPSHKPTPLYKLDLGPPQLLENQMKETPVAKRERAPWWKRGFNWVRKNILPIVLSK